MKSLKNYKKIPAYFFANFLLLITVYNKRKTNIVGE